MTLIMTAMSAGAVVQVADRRLTVNGALHEDLAIKAICICCKDASFSLAYTGLAQVGDLRTDIWAFDFLESIGAGNLEFGALYERFKEHLTKTFRRLPLLPRARGITFVFGGFLPPGPFIGQLSNMEDEKGCALPRVAEDFRSFFKRPRRSLRRLPIMINGAERSVAKLAPAIAAVGRHCLHRTPEEIANTLVQLVRRAADDPDAGRYVGKNCLSSIVRPGGQFVCHDHREKAATEGQSPHAILRGTTFRDIQNYDGPPPWLKEG